MFCDRDLTEENGKKHIYKVTQKDRLTAKKTEISGFLAKFTVFSSTSSDRSKEVEVIGQATRSEFIS